MTLAKPIALRRGAASAGARRQRRRSSDGSQADKVPACLSCHDKAGANPAYPKLSGQNAAYLRQQLALFHAGTRGGSSFGHLMLDAAKGLKPEDIDALAAYFSSRESMVP